MMSFPILIVVGIFAMVLIYRSSVSDIYHAPPLVVLLALIRTLSLLVLSGLVLTWSWAPASTSNSVPTGIILLDESAGDRSEVSAMTSRLKAKTANRGGRTVTLSFNAAPDHETTVGKQVHGRFTSLPPMITALDYLTSLAPDSAIALISQSYPMDLRDPSLENAGISWFKAEPAIKSDPVQVLKAPRSVFSGQMLNLEAKLAHSKAARQAVFSVNGSNQETRQVDGSGEERPSLYFETTAGKQGITSLELAILDEYGDALSVHTWPVDVLPKPSIIYFSPAGRSAPLAKYLTRIGIRVEHRSHYDLLSDTGISFLEQGRDSILIFDSIPGPFFNRPVVARLHDAVYRLGYSLVVLPGSEITHRDRGGPLERILPVKFGLEKKAKPTTDLAFVAMVDTSLSMFFNTEGISSFAHKTSNDTSAATKISMAKKAVMNLAQAVPATDRFGVLTVTDKPSWIFKPSTPRAIGEEPELISRINAFGPGINLYSGLLASFNELVGMNSDLKHVLVFLDTADVDEYQVADRGTVWELLADFREQKISVSLIGFGKADDPHIPELNRFAEESGGYFYLTSDIRQIPGFGLMDLKQVTESLVNFQARNVEFFTSDFPGTDSFPEIKGQVITTLKPGASLFAWSDRELPLIAAWPFGLGKVAIVAADGGQVLAKGWDDHHDVWSKILARIQSMERDDTELFYSNSEDPGTVYARTDPSVTRTDLSMIASFPDGSRRSIPIEKVAHDRFISRLPDHGSIPNLLELRTSETENRLAMQVLSNNPTIASEDDVYETPPFEPSFVKPGEVADRNLDPSMLKLLIVFIVFLLVIDEFFRPPGMEATERLSD